MVRQGATAVGYGGSRASGLPAATPRKAPTRSFSRCRERGPRARVAETGRGARRRRGRGRARICRRRSPGSFGAPGFAPHLAQAARTKFPRQHVIGSTLRRGIQSELEALARHAADKIGDKVSVAIVMADSTTGDILADVGSADFLDSSRRGWVEMSRAIRSPGSTLKPFIYGLAFENGLVSQETIIEDRPADFSGYRPRNFDMQYQGDVSIRQALQLSLNVPAVKLLDAVSPAALMVRFRRASVNLALPKSEPRVLPLLLVVLACRWSISCSSMPALPIRGSRSSSVMA